MAKVIRSASRRRWRFSDIISYYAILVTPLLVVLLWFFFVNGGGRCNCKAGDLVRVDRQSYVKPAPTPAPVETVPAPAVMGVLPPALSPTVLRWEPLIVEAAWRYDFDPLLLAIIVQIESCGNPNALSPAGARGLGQVMPYHFTAEEDPYDPVTNLNRAAAYYHEGLVSSNYDIGLSFAGYNGGHLTVQQGRWNWKSETVRYYDWATGIYLDLKNNTGTPTLDRWLAAGGKSLCDEAAKN